MFDYVSKGKYSRETIIHRKISRLKYGLFALNVRKSQSMINLCAYSTTFVLIILFFFFVY